jgi:hypothetical protein
VNAQDGVPGIVLAAEHLTHLEVGDALVDGFGLGHAFRERVRVAFDGELEEDAGVVELAALALPAVERRGQLRAFTLDLLGPLVIVPEVGLPDLLVEDLEARFGSRDVKDAPAASRGASPTPSTAPSARSS